MVLRYISVVSMGLPRRPRNQAGNKHKNECPSFSQARQRVDAEKIRRVDVCTLDNSINNVMEIPIPRARLFAMVAFPETEPSFPQTGPSCGGPSRCC